MRAMAGLALFLMACVPGGPPPEVVEFEASDDLRASALIALELVPDWIRDDLALSLRRLRDPTQDELAQLIVDLSDPFLIDEVAFTIAHLSPEVLEDPAFYPELIVENAEWVYRVEPELAYVDIVEHGVPGADPDFWSTTTYRTVLNGQMVDVQIDRDIYYWFVVHPRIEDERPYYIDAWADCSSGGMECPTGPELGMFWREFFWEGAAEECPDGAYCPVLSDALSSSDHLWNGLAGGDATGAIREIVDFMRASDPDAGRWLSFGAFGERSIQPVRISGLGRGNCGEWSDVTSALSRAALIPNYNVAPSSWDHTWNEFWSGDDWIAWEPVNLWIDHPYNVSFAATATRGDTSQFMRTAKYNSEIFQMEVRVRDSVDERVDGASVSIYSPHNDGWWQAGELATDGEGIASFPLVAGQRFSYRVDHPLGSHPAAEGQITPGPDGVAADETAIFRVQLDGVEMPVGRTAGRGSTDGPVHLTLALSKTEGRILGTSYRFGESFTRPDLAPAVDLWVMDRPNYVRFRDGETFTAVGFGEGAVDLPLDKRWFIVADNGRSSSRAAFGTLDLSIEAGAGAAFADSVQLAFRYQLLPGGHMAWQLSE
jgi:hypothetical protein